MRLEDLLKYDDITIQCHDDLDADTIASGCALLKYLESEGKRPRLVYSSAYEDVKCNLRLMLDMFQIPLEHVREPDGEAKAQLLVTVDCRASQGNVSVLPHEHVAVIDHHSLDEGEVLPELSEVRGYGACTTVLWAMLKDAGYAGIDRQLSTVLYYGLYMDTNELKNISHPMDRDMRDSLKIDADAMARLKSANLSLDEIAIAGQAFASLHYDPEHRFAVAQVRPCNANILGVVADMVMSVDTVDVCVAYHHKPGEGAKLSVRSCLEEPDADRLAKWLVRGLGDDGGGDPKKAGGRVPEGELKRACIGDGWDDLSGAAGRLIYRRLTDLFVRDGDQKPVQLRGSGYRLDGSEVLYRKKKVPIGYVPAEQLFPAGTEILIRMLEGDAVQKVTPGLCIKIGVACEIYPSEMGQMLEHYDLLPDAYPIECEYPPKVYDIATGEAKALADHAKQCVAKDTALIWARQLDCRTEVFPKRRDGEPEAPMLGEAGDWLAVQADDLEDIYIIKGPIFEKTYEEAGQSGDQRHPPHRDSEEDANG